MTLETRHVEQSDLLMDAKVRTLMLDMLAWIDARPRTYAQAIDAWRSSCPRHPVWDDALLEGLIQVATPADNSPRDSAAVTLTPRGRALLCASSFTTDDTEKKN